MRIELDLHWKSPKHRDEYLQLREKIESTKLVSWDPTGPDPEWGIKLEQGVSLAIQDSIAKLKRLDALVREHAEPRLRLVL